MRPVRLCARSPPPSPTPHPARPLHLTQSRVPCPPAVRQLALAPDGIVVVHDDLEREFGKVALKKGGSAGYAPR